MGKISYTSNLKGSYRIGWDPHGLIWSLNWVFNANRWSLNVWESFPLGDVISAGGAATLAIGDQLFAPSGFPWTSYWKANVRACLLIDSLSSQFSALSLVARVKLSGGLPAGKTCWQRAWKARALLSGNPALSPRIPSSRLLLLLLLVCYYWPNHLWSTNEHWTFTSALALPARDFLFWLSG